MQENPVRLAGQAKSAPATPLAAPPWRSAMARHVVAIELVVLAVLIPGALLLARPHLAGVFIALLTLVPVLFGLRYGFGAGSAAALLLTLVLLHHFHLQPQGLATFPKLQAAMYLLCGSLTGQFRDYWIRMMNDACARASLDRLRLAQFTSTFHVLKASHAQLERRLGANRTSLRAALQQLKTRLAAKPADPAQPLAGLGAPLLELLAECCHLHSGTAYEVNVNGLIAPTAAASFGKATPLSPFHPMLREALSTGNVVSVRANDSGVEKILAVVPLVDSLGHVHGVISINQMAFIAIQQATLDLMAIIARHAGDILAAHGAASADAGSSEALLQRLRRSMADARLHRLPLAVVGFRIVDAASQNALVAQCSDVQRGVDQSWLGRDRQERAIVVVLMPMPDTDAAQRYVQRVRDHVAQQHGSAVAATGIESFVIMLEDACSAEEALPDVLQACDIGCSPGNTPTSTGLHEGIS